MLPTTNSFDLVVMADGLHMKQFVGVFSINTLPTTLYTKNVMFITNTDTNNLPGKHWIAVMIRDGIGYCFDPLG